jgi:hypothetical protein
VFFLNRPLRSLKDASGRRVFSNVQGDFNLAALPDVLDRQRRNRALTWQGVARGIWNQSERSTLTGTAKPGDTTCQHALFMLRWLGRTPESFPPSSTDDAKMTPLPFAGPDQWLRWDPRKLYAALDSERRERSLTWPQLAREW